MHDAPYIPALGHRALTRFYDLFIALTLRERKLKTRLLEQARIAPGHAVLDVGCGTGTLALLAKQRVPSARVVGLDGDPAVLAIARRKIERAGAQIELLEALADSHGAFPPASFDRVLSSLVFHHLSHDQRQRALAAIRVWLRPEGELHVLDFGPPRSALGAALSRLLAVHGAERVRDHWEGRLPEQMRAAGFVAADVLGSAFTPFGSVSFYRATLS